MKLGDYQSLCTTTPQRWLLVTCLTCYFSYRLWHGRCPNPTPDSEADPHLGQPHICFVSVPVSELDIALCPKHMLRVYLVPACHNSAAETITCRHHWFQLTLDFESRYPLRNRNGDVLIQLQLFKTLCTPWTVLKADLHTRRTSVEFGRCGPAT